MILLDQPRKNLSKVLEVITFPMIHRVNEQQGNKVKAHPAPHVQKTLSHHDKTQRQTVTWAWKLNVFGSGATRLLTQTLHYWEQFIQIRIYIWHWIRQI